MRSTTLACLALLVFGHAQATKLSFEDAKTRADQDKEQLSDEDEKALFAARGEFAMSTRHVCQVQGRGVRLIFTIVVKMGDDGRVAATWLDMESDYATCIRQLIEREFSMDSDAAPFFWSSKYNITVAP